MRYFRSTPAIYEAICAQLDAAYGYPNAETKTFRTLQATESLPVDGQGRVYVAVNSDYCEFILPSQMLPELLASGAVEEITAEQYLAVLPPDPALP